MGTRYHHTGQSEYIEDNEVGRYARDLESRDPAFVWYHGGVRMLDERAWAMDPDVAWKVSVSVERFLVPTPDGVFAIEREPFEESTTDLFDSEQLLARESDDFVTKVGDPSDLLGHDLWIESGNEVHEGYHQEAGH